MWSSAKRTATQSKGLAFSKLCGGSGNSFQLSTVRISLRVYLGAHKHEVLRPRDWLAFAKQSLRSG